MGIIAKSEGMTNKDKAKFADQIIALREELRRRQDMTMQTTYVTGVSDTFPTFLPLLFLIDFEAADSASEHVTGVGKSKQHVVKESETAIVTIGHEMAHGAIDIVLIIERFDLIGLPFLLMRVLSVDLFIIGAHILLLDEGGVG